MHYLFLGEGTSAKDKRLLAVKKKTLKSPKALQFDYEVLHAHRLDPLEFKKSLLALPAMAPQRLVLIREAHRLSDHNQDLLLEFLDSRREDTVLVLDSEKWETKSAFVKKLKKRKFEIVEFGGSAEPDVFLLTRKIGQRRSKDALKVLYELLDAGIHPLQIMGVLVWYWGNKCRRRVSPSQFRKGLDALQEADLNIKRSRLKPGYSLELVVVKLSTPKRL